MGRSLVEVNLTLNPLEAGRLTFRIEKTINITKNI